MTSALFMVASMSSLRSCIEILQAIATFGSDFTLIASLFPSKNRRQIKNKYSKECKVGFTPACLPLSNLISC